jgi:siroheme synthase
MGAAAAAQIPLTHRRASDALVLITAHRASEENASDWSKFVGSGATLVIYMPGQNYADIARRLTAAGLVAETPCAIVSRATTKYQRTHRTTVKDLHRSPQLASPTLLVVGEVVRLSDPAAIVEGFVTPNISPGNDGRVPLALFNDIRPSGNRARE